MTNNIEALAARLVGICANWNEVIRPVGETREAPIFQLIDAALEAATALRELAAERDAEMAPTWACAACGSSGDGFKTVKHTIPMEPTEYDVECLACGSLDTHESPEEALSVAVDTINELAAERDRLARENRALLDENKNWSMISMLYRPEDKATETERLLRMKHDKMQDDYIRHITEQRDALAARVEELTNAKGPQPESHGPNPNQESST